VTKGEEEEVLVDIMVGWLI